MMILLREIVSPVTIRLKLSLSIDHPLPPAFNPSTLPVISRSQIVYFDEIHIEQHGGPITSDGNQIRFPRNSGGTFHLEGGYGDKLYCPTFKYPSQARFCLGVAKVSLLDGSTEGRRCDVFDYMQKKIVTIKDYELAVKSEIKRVKYLNIKSAISTWIVDTRPNGYDEYHEEDEVSVLKGVGKTTMTKLNKHGIYFVGDLKRLSNDDAHALNAAEKVHNFKVVRSLAEQAIPGKNPFQRLNLTKFNRDGTPTDNPYRSRYGDRWREAIECSTALSPIVCITELVKYMMRESARVMSGTKHADNWYFYHDALSLMTAKQTRDWMCENDVDGNNCMSKWLVPMCGCNSGTKFANRSVGNSPEFMPLDNSLNNDVKKTTIFIVHSHLIWQSMMRGNFQIQHPN